MLDNLGKPTATGFSSQGRTKLCAFQCYISAENKQLSLSLTQKPGTSTRILSKINLALYSESLKGLFFTWLWDFSSCSCLSALPGPSWVLLSKTYKPFSLPLYFTQQSYCLEDINDPSNPSIKPSVKRACRILNREMKRKTPLPLPSFLSWSIVGPP